MPNSPTQQPSEPVELISTEVRVDVARTGAYVHAGSPTTELVFRRPAGDAGASTVRLWLIGDVDDQLRMIVGVALELVDQLDAAGWSLPTVDLDARISEVRSILVDDVLRCLGIPAAGAPLEVDEVSVTDVRTARRLGERARDLLDQVVEEHQPSLRAHLEGLAR